MKTISPADAELVKAYLRLIEAGFDSNGNVSGFYFRGTLIPGVTSYTWAQFTDAGFDLTTARFVHVSDKHSSSNLYGGSLWRIDPSGTTGKKHILMSDPLVFTNLSDAPSPVTYPGLKVKITSLFNAELESDGSFYRPSDSHLTLKVLSSAANHTGSPNLATEQVLFSVLIPRDANNKSILQNNDSLIIDRAMCSKTGTADFLAARIRFGTAGTIADTLIETVTTATGGNVSLNFNGKEFVRTSSTALQASAPDGASNLNGYNNAAYPAADTVTDIDSAAMYLSLSYYLSAVTTDTAISLKHARVVMKRGF